MAWFSQNGRDLPWRKTRDPYAILVSEVMLQQTQVARVVPRYLAWIDRWPSVDSLAAATPADVIREWQGLGYNRRALNLHRAAGRIAATGWPDDLTELPGVGRYTADAVARFALDRPVLPVDVNVRRVLDRTEGSFGPASAHALMDLGATVCLARIPRCGECPLADGCPSRGQRYEPLRKQSRFEGSPNAPGVATHSTRTPSPHWPPTASSRCVAASSACPLVQIRLTRKQEGFRHDHRSRRLRRVDDP